MCRCACENEVRPDALNRLTPIKKLQTKLKIEVKTK